MLRSNLIDDNIDQTHPLDPLEVLTAHLRELIILHYENDSRIQNRKSLATNFKEKDSRSLYLTRSHYVSGGKNGEKSYMLFTVSASPTGEVDDPAKEIFGLELAVRTIT